uniref:Uncharacterized protein n=1 Tax=Scleropages formosus TaxID=113540 RepID=A0A8D0CIJ1_SCLFO
MLLVKSYKKLSSVRHVLGGIALFVAQLLLVIRLRLSASSICLYSLVKGVLPRAVLVGVGYVEQKLDFGRLSTSTAYVRKKGSQGVAMCMQIARVAVKWLQCTCVTTIPALIRLFRWSEQETELLLVYK